MENTKIVNDPKNVDQERNCERKDTNSIDNYAINAKAARTIADAPFKVLKQIYKLVKDAATYSRTCLIWSAAEMSKVALKAVIDDLEAHGYEVVFKDYDIDDDMAIEDAVYGELHISW